MSRSITYASALQEATDIAMAEDERVFVAGIGVDDFKGTYGTTGGLIEKYGASRVQDTPLSEDAMTGIMIGAALAGMRPIHVHIRMDFLLLAMNQLINIAAKARYTFGGAVNVPLVVRGVIGKSWGQGAQHSQGLYPLFMHIPGLRVVAPTTPYDAKGCLLASIKEENPVVFVEHRILHFQTGHVPIEPYVTPVGRGRLLSQGSDLTIVGISYMAVECMRAQSCLAVADVSAEVIDPVWLAPLDTRLIADSVRRTRRLLIVENSWLSCGAGAEIIASVSEQLGPGVPFEVRRLGFAPVPCPTSQSLEADFYPDARRIARVAMQMVAPQRENWEPDESHLAARVEFKGPF